MALKMTDQSTQEQKNILNNHKGQSLVEFILLISAIMLISLSFLRLTNSGIAKYWLYMGNLLNENQSQQLKLR
jgi:hypothetical protein